MRSRGAAALVLLGLLQACGSDGAGPAPAAAPDSVVLSRGGPEDRALPAPPPASRDDAPRLPRPGRPASLAGRVVALDPGHNGHNSRYPGTINALVEAGGFRKPCNTTGTSTDSGYTESAFAFDLAQRTAAVLRRMGADVALTRDGDTGVGPCVDDRARFAGRVGADVLVSLHADGAPPDAAGFHVIEPGLAPDAGNRDILPRSRRLATDVRAALLAAGHTPATYPAHLVEPGRTRRHDLAGLNLARVPAVLVECGNMRNLAEAQRLQDPVWRQSTAEAVADGITEHLSSPMR